MDSITTKVELRKAYKGVSLTAELQGPASRNKKRYLISKP
jgi:hypothetical protein